MIEVHNLTKRYGDAVAVDDISFTVQPGIITGFLGPNGAGKSTTMRMILGLDRPTSGHTLVNGRSYSESPAPLHELGALLDAKAIDKGRSARNHLLALGATVGVGAARVDELLEVVGLTHVARKPAGSFSLGMGQRLGIAAALLADPTIVMLDEPVNGLDPDGIMWIRSLLREFADEGRTVFLSSHLMSEMELTADHLIVIGQGHILADTSMSDFIASNSATQVKVVSPFATVLRDLLVERGASVTSATDDEILVSGFSAPEVGELAARNGLTLHALTPQAASLEEAFMTLTRDAVQYRGHAETNQSETTVSTRKAA